MVLELNSRTPAARSGVNFRRRAIDRALELSTRPGVILCFLTGEHASGWAGIGRAQPAEQAWPGRARPMSGSSLHPSMLGFAIAARSSRLPCGVLSRMGFETTSAWPPPCLAHQESPAVGLYQLGSGLWCMCGSPPRPAMEALLASSGRPCAGLPGRLATVCAVMGSEELGADLPPTLSACRWWFTGFDRLDCWRECCACGAAAGDRGGEQGENAYTPRQPAAGKTLAARP